MNAELERKMAVIKQILEGKISRGDGAETLACSPRTIRRYLRAFLDEGPDGLRDHRHSNNRKLTSKDEKEIVRVKREGPWRSARKVGEILNLSVHPVTIWRVLVKHGMAHLNYEGVKPIKRFVAKAPNDLWQADIMGKVKFPNLGVLYLIAVIDDHSRFILSAKWFRKQTKINVFRVWYHALCHYGLPKAMLQDRGSQYKAHRGEADYQYYARLLGIELKYANKARTKGKIERFWRFVQQDFVRENLEVDSVEELNRRFFAWQRWFNYRFRSNGLGMDQRTPSEVYHPSERRRDPQELRTMLVIEERRKVMRDSTISLYGHRYRVPPGYINCRIWVKIIGDKVIFEAMDKVIWKQRLKI